MALLQTECFCPPPPTNSYVVVLPLSGMILYGRTFGKQLGLDEVMRGKPDSWISALIKEEGTPESLSLCEVSARRQLCGSQEESIHQMPNLLAP